MSGNIWSFFVDQDNNPFHQFPLQLTRKECFQIEFDQQLCKFRIELVKAYNEKVNSMKNYWYSMCVFVPTSKVWYEEKENLVSP